MVKLSNFNLVFPFNHKYDVVFNSLYGSLVLVDKEVGAAIRNGNLDLLVSDREIYNQLKSANIILDDDVDEKEVYYKVSREFRFNNKAIIMFLGLTSKCNLACRYCYQSLRKTIDGADLTEDKWRIIRGFLERRVREGYELIAIALYGGEPLLNPRMARRVIDDIDELSRKHGVQKEIMLITNGTILNREVEEIVNRVDAIQVTIDGPRVIHDERRPFKNNGGSFEVITSNLIKLVGEYDKYVGVRVNVDEHNVDYIKELVDYLLEVDVGRRLGTIDFSPVHPDQADIYNPLKTSKSLLEYYTRVSRRIVDTVEYAVERGFKVGKMFIKGPCMCKYVTGYAVDENLNIYMCPAYMYTQPIGKIISDRIIAMDPGRYKPITSDPDCTRNCKYAPICYGGCIYLQHKNIPTCLRVIYGDEYLEKLIRAYIISTYGNTIVNKESLNYVHEKVIR
ncbi:MAG: radical SAM protein [Desulfurococcaceae archaeon]